MASTTVVDIYAPDGTQGPALELTGFTDSSYRLQNLIPGPGGQYTFSVWAKADADMQVVFNVLGESFAADITTDWAKVSYTVADAADVYIDIYPMADNPLYLYKGMLQKGQFDTDWKPAPEDGEAVEADLTEKAAALALDVDGIIAQVSRQSGDIDGLQEQMTAIQQTADGVSIQVQSIIYNGVTKVKTEMGYSFGDDGMKIERSDSEVATRIDNTGMTVFRSEDPVLQANIDGVLAVDVTVRNYLIVGTHARFEDYGTDRTACFYI